MLTICIEGRQPVLVGEVRELIAERLSSQIQENGGPITGWVVMPDHVHILLTGAGDVVRWVRLFKSAVTTSCRKGLGKNVVWQRSFYDRGIRPYEKMDDVARYMLSNPVRADLAAQFDEWPWSYMAGMKSARK